MDTRQGFSPCLFSYILIGRDIFMELKTLIDDADMVLVGIGEEFQTDFSQLEILQEEQNTIFEEYARMMYLDNHKADEVDNAYRVLKILLENKDYFVVTLCNDDRIYDSGIGKERIVAPCGSYHRLQCENVCSEEIYPVQGYLEEIRKRNIPICPHCGKNLIINRVGISKYSEEGYLAQWNEYTKWLQRTLNKKLLILELGVGMKYPSVIRWPVEKIAFLNKKAKLVRINSLLYQLPEEIKEEGIAVCEESVRFLINQIV